MYLVNLYTLSCSVEEYFSEKNCTRIMTCSTKFSGFSVLTPQMLQLCPIIIKGQMFKDNSLTEQGRYDNIGYEICPHAAEKFDFLFLNILLDYGF